MFPEASELRVNNTHTIAIEKEPLPRALLEILCRRMRQRSLGLQSGLVCSFSLLLLQVDRWLVAVVRVQGQV